METISWKERVSISDLNGENVMETESNIPSISDLIGDDLMEREI